MIPVVLPCHAATQRRLEVGDMLPREIGCRR